MKQKQNYLNRYTVSALGIFLTAAVAAFIVFRHSPTEATPSIKPGVGAAVPSKFTTSGLVGWWQGATRKTDMALFQSSHECFTSIQYHPGTVDVAAELQKLSVSQAGTGGTSVPGAILPMTLQTPSGPRQYELHQYSLTSGDSNQPLMRGLELGYLQLSDAYIQVEGHCNTPDQLAATIPALQSIRFDESK